MALDKVVKDGQVSTHSRLKAAGGWDTVGTTMATVSTHSRLKAAGIHPISFLGRP